MTANYQTYTDRELHASIAARQGSIPGHQQAIAEIDDLLTGELDDNDRQALIDARYSREALIAEHRREVPRLQAELARRPS